MGSVTPSLLFVTRHQIRNAATFDAFRRAVLKEAEKRRRHVVIDARPLVAYVNYGRWVADCHHCFAGIALDPEWSQAFCLECFRSYVSIRWPLEIAEIESALVGRWLRNQHWNTIGGMRRDPLAIGETAAQLRDENDQSTDPPPPPVRDQIEATWLGLLL